MLCRGFCDKFAAFRATALTTALTTEDSEKAPECVDLLIRAGAEINGIVNDSGETALFLAAKAGNAECIKVLLKADVQINVKHIDGLNALTEYFMGSDNTSEWVVEEKVAMLLSAAGESLNLRRFGAKEKFDVKTLGLPIGTEFHPSASFVKWLLQKEQNHSLKSICREVIRGWLMMVNPHRNLFLTLLETGLPASLQRYLVYEKLL